MKLIRFATALAALTLAACATKPHESLVDFVPDYNLRQPKTIGFYAMSGEVTGNNPTELTDLWRDRTDAALQGALEARGFVFVDKTVDADLLLSWHLNLMEETDVRVTLTL